MAAVANLHLHQGATVVFNVGLLLWTKEDPTPTNFDVSIARLLKERLELKIISVTSRAGSEG